MSMELTAKALDTEVGNSLRKLILVKLADNANDQGIAWPSHQHLADICETTRRSVITHLGKLAAMGFISIKQRKTAADRNQSNLYFLHPDKWPKVQRTQNKAGCENFSPLEEEAEENTSEKLSHSSKPNTPSSDPTSLTSSDPISQRTSHSLEPIKENICNLGKADFSAEQIVELFNQFLPSLPKVKKLTSTRISAITARTKQELKTLNAWRDFFDAVSNSDFLMGKTSSWQATFDWITKESNFVKIIEGNYDNKSFSGPSSQAVSDPHWYENLGL